MSGSRFGLSSSQCCCNYVHLPSCTKGFNFLISGMCNEQFRSPMIKQMREWAGNLQPQFLLTALLLGTDQLHGFVGVEGKMP